MLLFIAVFGALLVTATFTDLQVSHILTAKALAAHTYYTNETTYGVVLEAVGSSPVYLMLAFSFQILFWQVMRKMKKHPWKEILAILLLVGIPQGHIDVLRGSYDLLCNLRHKELLRGIGR